jgi:hypothetical protein
MERKIVDAATAFGKVLRQKYKHWRFSEGNPDHAGSRIAAGDIFLVDHSPRFRISPADVVFTIGSCFARNVEEHLISKAVRVVTADFALPQERYAARSRSNAVLNKYSTASILSELQATLVGNKPPQHALIDLGDGTWFDPHASITKPADLATVLDTRRRIAETTKKITQSDVVFITLGLTESWLDQDTGLVLNLPPPFNLIRRSPGRFAWYNSSYEDSLDCMEQTLDLIWTYCRADMRIIVTVSPVPLQTTFSGRDIAVANTYSKAVLRCVADTLMQRHDLVDYYPSYEMVMNSPRAITWEDDQIHVKNTAVKAVVGRFVDLYLATEVQCETAAAAV